MPSCSRIATAARPRRGRSTIAQAQLHHGRPPPVSPYARAARARGRAGVDARIAIGMRGERRGGFFSAAFFVFLGAGLCVFGWQALTWLTKSTWRPLTVVDALNWMHIRWALSPGNLPELHQMLAHTPLALVLLGVAGVCFLIYALLN